MLKSSEVKTGNFLKYKENYHIVLKKEIYTPSGSEIQVKLKMFNLDTGETVNNSVPEHQEFEPAELDKKEMKLIHKTEKTLIFSDEEGNEQLEINSERIGDQTSFLHEKSVMEVFYYKDMIVSVELPKIVIFDIDYTEDIEKDSSNLEYLKEARLSNGHTIKVPAFVKTGDKVRIHTESGEYICRD
jgi:elongation factor P